MLLRQKLKIIFSLSQVLRPVSIIDLISKNRWIVLRFYSFIRFYVNFLSNSAEFFLDFFILLLWLAAIIVLVLALVEKLILVALR